MKSIDQHPKILRGLPPLTQRQTAGAGAILDVGSADWPWLRYLKHQVSAVELLTIDWPAARAKIAELAVMAAPGGVREGMAMAADDLADPVVVKSRKFGLIFSHGAGLEISDTRRWLERLAQGLVPEGTLAIEFPADPTHPWVTTALHECGPLTHSAWLARTEAPEVYADTLQGLGFADIEVERAVAPEAWSTRGAPGDPSFAFTAAWNAVGARIARFSADPGRFAETYRAKVMAIGAVGAFPWLRMRARRPEKDAVRG